MGQIIKKDLAISVDLWKAMLDRCEGRMSQAESFEVGARWTMIGAYLTFIYVLSLRGPEGFQIEISILHKRKDLRNGLVWIPIVGNSILGGKCISPLDVKFSKTLLQYPMRELDHLEGGVTFK